MTALPESSRLPRRDFLRTSAALLALAATASPRHAFATPASSTERRIRKAVKLGMVQEGKTLQEKFQLLVDLGFDGVELGSPNSLELEEVLAAKEATGLPIHGVVDSVHWNQPLSHADAEVRAQGLKGLQTALHDCKAYGGSTVLLVPAVVNKSISYADAYDRSQEEIGKVLPQAQEFGIKIALENVWNQFLLSPLEAARYVDEFESNSIGWYFDVGNVVNYGWPEQWVEILGERILKLDIKEYSRQKRDAEGLWKGFQVELLEGDCDWPAVMKALDKVGFEGWATAEVAGGDATRLADLKQRMDRIFAS